MSRTSIRRIAVLLLAVAGGWLLLTGIQRWLDRRAAQDVVNGFLTAIRDGDRDAALSHLEADRREEVEAAFQSSAGGEWAPLSGIAWRINEFAIDGDSARAKLFIEKDGFVLEPVMHLVRTATSSWKVLRIEDLQADPRWQDLKREAARIEGDETARELADALKGQPGVSVQRPSAQRNGKSP
ncbi:MAG: hypothetical protein ACE5KM_00180 [Planctomycetaceae bacterium]